MGVPTSCLHLFLPPSLHSFLAVQSCPYRNYIREKFQRMWTVEARLPVPEHFYRESVETQYQMLVALCALSEGPPVVVLRGLEGSGKTTMVRKLMLDWAEGKVWRDRFSFVFLIVCSDLNQLSETSLEEILARDWPADAEPLETAFKHPKSVLLIVDSLYLFMHNLDGQTGDCEDWQQRASPATVLNHLLRQNLVPGVTLLVTGDYKDRDIEKGTFLGQSASYVTLPGFTELTRKLYFSHFFRNTRHASTAFAYVESNSGLAALCESPMECWIVCCCLQGQMARGQALNILCNTGTSLYLSFLTSIFPRGAEGRSPMQNYARLRALCILAAEGVWTGTYIFGPEHLQRNGLTDADVQVWLGRKLLQQRGELVVFAHEVIQDFCASLLYVLQQPHDGGIANPHIGSVARLLDVTLDSGPRTLSHLPYYVFGLTKEVLLRKLEATLGCPLGRATRPELVSGLSVLANRPGPVNFQNLLTCLFETQEPEFTGEIMDLFPDLRVKIHSTEELTLMTFCLRSCKKLKKLRFQLDPSFAEPTG